VRGHTDSFGERSYNLGLSQRRADAVVAYMERNGIASSRVEAVGVGPDEPVADNRTRAGRAQNRRIEIVVE
jgi:outer membrane protein OmpA-like peptidoglycan-associated protein